MRPEYSFKKLQGAFFAILFSAAALCLPASAFATQATTTIAVSLIIASGCTISANPLTFPTASGPGDQTKTTQIDITCTTGTTYAVGIDAGLHSADVAARKMEGPAAATLTYSIYQDSLHTLVWGNTQGVNTVSGTGNGVNQELVAYGIAPEPSPVPGPGTYTDTVTVYIYY